MQAPQAASSLQRTKLLDQTTLPEASPSQSQDDPLSRAARPRGEADYPHLRDMTVCLAADSDILDNV